MFHGQITTTTTALSTISVISFSVVWCVSDTPAVKLGDINLPVNVFVYEINSFFFPVLVQRYFTLSL